MNNYFSHDYYSRNDPKIVRLFMKHGLAGIGAYWCIVEMLYEEGGYLPLSEYERITFELRTTENVIRYLIDESNLFINDGEKFWSETAIERLNKRAEKKQKARESIENRWNKKKENTNVLRTYYEGNTIKEKEIKEKEIKVNIKETTKSSDLYKNFIELIPDEWKEILFEWLEFKKAIKDNYKNENSLKKLFEHLKELSGGDPETAKKIINQSIANNWKGLFALKNNQYAAGQKNSQPTNTSGFSRPGYDPNNGIGNGEQLSTKKRPVIF